MPFPVDQAAMFDAGYEYARIGHCSDCGEPVEVWRTPGKRELQMEFMPSSASPATKHYEACNIAPKKE